MADNKYNSKYNKPKDFVKDVSLELGKMPPQALELEEAVLGAIMLEKDAVISILDVLKPESFYKEQNQIIFECIKDLSANLEAIDILTVTESLRKKGVLEKVGGPFYITQLTNKVATTAHIEFHAKIIAQKFIQRELIRVSSDIQNKAFDESYDVDDLLDYSERALFQIAEGNIKNEAERINTVFKQAVKEIELAGSRGDGLSGVPSGFTKLDRLTAGWQASDLIILAARPAMGKTAFVVSMARNMAVDHNAGCAIFSLEMASVQLVNRLVVGETGIPADSIRKGSLDDKEWDHLHSATRRLVQAPIFIDDTPGISVFEFRAKARRLKMQHDIKMIIIDYLQLMTGPPETKGNREQEVSMISRSLKGVAKELGVPIIALSQLNRSVEMRAGDKRPQMSDLRESGAIEQDADIICFVHRPEYFGFLEDEEGRSLVGIAEIIFAKHRNGGLDTIHLRFKAEHVRFYDPEADIIDGPGEEQAALPANPGDANVTTFSSKMNEDPFASAKNDPLGGEFDITPNNANLNDNPF